MMEMNSPYRTNSNTSSNTFRENMKKESLERKKSILHLILKYLLDNNLNSVAEVLQQETQTGLYNQVCDNVDLDIIFQEYQSYYYMKFQKNPKILRKLAENEHVNPVKKDKRSAIKEKSQPTKPEKKEESFQFEIVTLSKESKDQSLHEIETKPLSDFENYSSEWREIADQIVKQIIPKTLGITFKDCISLTETVETVKEAIVYPLYYPQLFENVCTWKGILLYGPPGTGKTLLAKALACEAPSIFINVTSSAFISKWRGESEKMVKVLFDVAKFYSPTTIFIDEIDALASTCRDSNHEASRRFKSELLTQIDGIVKSEEVFVLATTNTPWAIDSALLRRFEKRILVPLPDKNSRNDIFRYYFKKMGHDFNADDLAEFVNSTDYFSGSDIKTVCKEVEMTVVREKLEQIRLGKGDRKKVRQAKCSDVMNALKKIKPCIEKQDYQKYLEWGAKYGAT